jgi:hypothetical protein
MACGPTKLGAQSPQIKELKTEIDILPSHWWSRRLARPPAWPLPAARRAPSHGVRPELCDAWYTCAKHDISLPAESQLVRELERRVLGSERRCRLSCSGRQRCTFPLDEGVGHTINHTITYDTRRLGVDGAMA